MAHPGIDPERQELRVGLQVNLTVIFGQFARSAANRALAINTKMGQGLV
jgi:hypothetical protein